MTCAWPVKACFLFVNTDERVSEPWEHLDVIISSRHLRRSDGERLRGRLQFACGQLFGRFARNHCGILSSHIRANKARIGDDTLHALDCIRDQMKGNVPRRIVGTLSDHVHIYVDASFEDGKYSGLGGALYDSCGRPLKIFSEALDPLFLDRVKREGQVTIIQELEMLAHLVAMET